MKNLKTSIIVASYEPDKKTLQEVLAGIEEEGGLAQTIDEPLKHVAEALANKAAKQSALGTGIGIYKTKVALAFNTQVGLAKVAFEPRIPRQTGQNAARYTKNKPFI